MTRTQDAKEAQNSQDAGTGLLGDHGELSPPRLIPQRKLHPVPQPQFVVDDSQIILDYVLRRPDRVGYLFVLQALGNQLDDSLFAFTRDSGSIPPICRHSCLRYSRVASLTRLIPPVIPNRRNKRLKCAFTVRRAIFSWLAISALSHPCKSSSTICCSRGPSRMVCSFIRPPLFDFALVRPWRLA